MAETLNGSYHDSEDKLPNSKNKGPENPEDTDLRKIYMKIGGDINKIVGDGRISDLGGEKLSQVRVLTSRIELDVISVLERLEINKGTKQELVKQKIELVSESFSNRVNEILNIT